MLTDRRNLDLALRITLIVAATISVSLDAPTAVSTTVTVLAFAATASALVRTRQLGWADAVAVAVAGLLVVLVVLGFALDALPPGLARVPWAIGSGVLAVAALAWDRRKPSDAGAMPPIDRRAALHLAPWYLGAAVLVAVALGISVHATRIANRPPLALSTIGSTSGDHVVVEIAGGRTSGRYKLVVTGGARGDAHTYGPFDVTAGHTVRSRIAVTTGIAMHVTLRDSSTAETLRSITVGGAATTTSGS